MYGAAVLASGIAVVSAIEAWIRLQQSAGAASLASNLAAEAGLAIALPLLAVVAAVGLRWGARSVADGRVGAGGAQFSPPNPPAGPEPRVEGTATPRATRRSNQQTRPDR